MPDVFTSENFYGPNVSGLLSDSGSSLHRTVKTFTPSDLILAGNAGFWLDPSDNSTLKQLSNGTVSATFGDPVGYVADKGRNGNNAIQALAGSRPTLRKSVSNVAYLEFDGIDDVLGFTAITAAAATMAVVCKLRTAGASKTALSISNQTLYADVNGSVWGTWQNGFILSSFNDLQLRSLVMRVRSATDVDLFTNYTKETPAGGTAYNPANNTIGGQTAGGFADIDLYQAFCVDRVLTDAEMEVLLNFMMSRVNL